MRTLLPFALAWMLAWPAAAAPVSTRPADGLREATPSHYALTGARIVAAPGRVIESGTIVVRDGRIEQVGADVVAPAGARIVDLAGRVVYAGFIDAFGEAKAEADPPGPGYWHEKISPQRSAAAGYTPDAALNKTLRSQGFAARLVAPDSGVIKGQSALVLLGDGDSREAILNASAAQHLRLTVGFSGGNRRYPTSPMGAVALARQAMIDAAWLREAQAALRADPALPRPEANLALQTLMGTLDGGALVLADAPNELFALRADAFAREFALRLALVGSGNEYRRLEAIRQTRRTVIVPVDFPKPPPVAKPIESLDAPLDVLMHWRLAPENPGRLAAAGVPIALTSHGLKDRGAFLKQVRKAVDRGLDRDAALAALTTTPAQLFGAEDQLGTLDPGQLANFVVADGDLFQHKTTLIATWVEGVEYKVKPDPVSDLSGPWLISASKKLGENKQWRLEVEGDGAKAKGTLAPVPAEQAPGKDAAEPPSAAASQSPDDGPNEAADPEDQDEGQGKQDSDSDNEDKDAKTRAHENEEQTENKKEAGPKKDADAAVTLKPFALLGYQLSGVADGKPLGVDGKVTIAATLSAGDPPKLVGSFVLPNGVQVAFSAVRTSDDERAEADKDEKSDAGAVESADEKDADAKDDAKKEGDEKVANEEGDVAEGGGKQGDDDGQKDKGTPAAIDVAVNYPLGAFGVTQAPQQEAVAFVGATVWTCGPAGVIENATVVVRDGVIERVGVDAPTKGCRVADAAGMHLTPGIIDCHSHIATDGGINESGQAITSEVRIGDFIDPDDITIYRQLAGGVTTANVLHGSANPIGGQNQVIKLRWGAGPEEMKFVGAPLGIKFALGENVKQSNWGERYSSRYPQTRMGVDELMIDAFRAAQGYRGELRRWERTGRGLPPRRDLELEALVEILEHQRWIHCHSYRQSEILALLRTLEGFGVQIGTLQHILEGYKLAPEIAAHGAMASSFADWWAYKFEVYDAIPYNGALMHNAGVVVSFNSDDHELGRHLNQDAAKAVKYGGVPPEEALKFVTLNAARQLRIDGLVGSVEPGKQADLTLWSGPPLSNFARCEQTWIDGRRYFSRSADAAARKRDAELKQRLIQLVLDSGESPAGAGDEKTDPSSLWPRCDIFCSGYDCR
ncbi:imidazolonepropionase [Pirellulimonas nuda]|uniref:Imidazolonepropionase n=1 Tax=Pirellulimonas nuda TaxID=2528009 RepID=A0A518D9A9_9BACT|nr:amidohydrolase family protein [Pirellulimonas nuda]QDU88061.1 imidazolonepropionase [Pirellulimonas nuda]